MEQPSAVGVAYFQSFMTDGRHIKWFSIRSGALLVFTPPSAVLVPHHLSSPLSGIHNITVKLCCCSGRAQWV